MQASSTSPASRRNTALVWLVAGAFSMEFLDSTVITTALPHMAESFHTQPIHLSAGVSAYMLALAVFLPLSGWMGDRFGAARVFGISLLIFSVASALCSLSNNLWSFIAARLLQGFAGAMTVPVGRMAVLRITPKEKLVSVIATLTWPALAAPILGPALGGFITTHWGWRWIFWVNVPLGVIGFLLTLWLVDNEVIGRRPFDVKGFILCGVGCCALMYAFDLAAQSPLETVTLLATGIVGIVASVWAVRHLLQAPHPLVELRAMRAPTFAAAMYGGSLFRIAINSMPFLMPLMFQLAFGMDAITSGVLLLALFAGNLCMKPITTPLMRRFGFRTVLLINGILVAAGFLLCIPLTAQTPQWLIMLVLFFTGLTRSMQFTGLSTMSFSDIGPEHMSGASTLSSILTQMSAGLGVALGAVCLRIAALWAPAPAHGIAPAAFYITFVIMTVLSAFGLYDLWRLPQNAGARVSGHKG